MSKKPKLILYSASSCGGCEVSFLNINEKIIDIDNYFDLIYCPFLLDTKKSDIESIPHRSVDITLFSGAIRIKEDEEMAHLLREKSKLLIALGSCSYRGGVSALSNLHTKREHMKNIYIDNTSIENPKNILPEKETEVPEGKLSLSPFFNRVETLLQTVDVDYCIPGCPPESHQIWNVFEKVIEGTSLAPKGSIIGSNDSVVCKECKRKKVGGKIKRIYRTHQTIPDKERCLLEQGIICFGLITRAGCGALCPKVNTPCTGCYGPLRDRIDMGAKAAAIVLSKFDKDEKIGASEENTINQLDDILYNSDAIPDFIGTFYKYGLALSQDIAERISD